VTNVHTFGQILCSTKKQSPKSYTSQVFVAAGELLTNTEQEAAYREALCPPYLIFSPASHHHEAPHKSPVSSSPPSHLSNLFMLLCASIDLLHEKVTNGEHSGYKAQVALAMKAKKTDHHRSRHNMRLHISMLPNVGLRHFFLHY